MDIEQDFRGSWRDWIASFHWTHFNTYTFAESRKPDRAIQIFERFLSRREIGKVLNPTVYVCEGSIEYGNPYTQAELDAMRARDATRIEYLTRPHIHALHESAHTALVWPSGRYWLDRYGRVQVGKVRGHYSDYIAKYISKNSERWGIC